MLDQGAPRHQPRSWSSKIHGNLDQMRERRKSQCQNHDQDQLAIPNAEQLHQIHSQKLTTLFVKISRSKSRWTNRDKRPNSAISKYSKRNRISSKFKMLKFDRATPRRVVETTNNLHQSRPASPTSDIRLLDHQFLNKEKHQCSNSIRIWKLERIISVKMQKIKWRNHLNEWWD